MAARGCVTPAETPYCYYYRSAVQSGKKEMESELSRGLQCFVYWKMFASMHELCVLA